MPEVTSGNLTEIGALATLLGSGVAWVVNVLRARHRERAAEPQNKLDANLITVVRARDELEADNDRLRGQMREEREQHANERAEWARERSSLREQVEHLESRLRALLDEVTELKTRTAPRQQ